MGCSGGPLGQQECSPSGRKTKHVGEVVAGIGNECQRTGPQSKDDLGKHKRPRQIEIVKELPKNFLGKILRRKLREEPSANSMTNVE